MLCVELYYTSKLPKTPEMKREVINEGGSRTQIKSSLTIMVPNPE